VARLVGRRRQVSLWQEGVDNLTALLNELADSEEPGGLRISAASDI
jgi:hypothetical protein